MEQRQVLTSLMASGLLEPAMFNRENNLLTQEEKRLHEEKNNFMQSVSSYRTKADALTALIKAVSRSKAFTKYDDALFLAHVEQITVVSRDEVIFNLKCGLKLKERLVG